MTANEILKLLYKNKRKFMSRFSWVIPNTYYVWRCEADLFCLTKSDYLYEYEIKVSRADFKNDSSKEVKLSRKYFKDYDIKSPFKSLKQLKMTWLSEGVLPPNYFSYIVPDNLVNVEEVPDFAGLYYINPKGLLKEIKKPDKLHSRKATLEEKYAYCKRLTARIFNHVIK